ncbi:hypothetical protein ATE48_18710 [Candidatus Viadribacter manganicus]|uniref:Uncharacterized protein n=1 Tax=Candidatus Viadribacter manganicus TaxID=1759059 RepID=A0A1B1AMK2_9PROT|nr:hypothetical protein ATE48_18710 [Candidatus Viadribacter manganicus]
MIGGLAVAQLRTSEFASSLYVGRMSYLRRIGRGFAVWLAFIPVMVVTGFVAEAIHFPWLIWAVPVAYLIVAVRVSRETRLLEEVERRSRKSDHQ